MGDGKLGRREEEGRLRVGGLGIGEVCVGRGDAGEGGIMVVGLLWKDGEGVWESEGDGALGEGRGE